MDNRATSPAVGKLLGIGLVLLYLSGATSVLVGSVVPTAQRATGQELAERVVADASARVERALEPVGGRVSGRLSLDLPPTIAGAGYRLALRDGRLRLRHPDPAIAATAGLGLPASVTALDGAVDAGPGVALVVRGAAGNRTVGLEEER